MARRRAATIERPAPTAPVYTIRRDPLRMFPWVIERNGQEWGQAWTEREAQTSIAIVSRREDPRGR